MNIKKLYKDESGAAGIFMILFITLVLLGFSALVVDAGMLYSTRRQMVTAADSGALAGAREMERTLTEDASLHAGIESAAIRIAKETAILNGASGEPTVEIKSIYVQGDAGSTPHLRRVIQVDVLTNEKLVFANFLGTSNSNVAASAIATWGFVDTVLSGALLPIYVTKYEYDRGIRNIHTGKINVDDENSLTEQRGFIKIDPTWSGINPIKTSLEGNAAKQTLKVDGVYDSQTGQGNVVRESIERRMINANALPTPEERRNFMMGLLPIVEVESDKPGANTTFKIVDFVVYEIRDVIAGKENPQPKNPMGSEYALSAPDYKHVGKGNETVYPPTDKEEFQYGTIIGEVVTDDVEIQVIVVEGDQVAMMGSIIRATYHKLIQ